MMDAPRPQVPKGLSISQHEWEKLLFNPVMAAKIIMGYTLDWFQRARLKYYWWCPQAEDSSGYSSGKTIVDWIFVNLRLILIPDQRAAVYYPGHSTGKETFWEYYTTCPGAIFHSQLGGTDREGKDVDDGITESGSTWQADYRNGNILVLPAPNFARKAIGQKSKRFNVVICEEWPDYEASGAIDTVLVGRCTRPCWNQYHPIWGNHFLMTGPARKSTHISSRRVRKIIRRAKAGDPAVHHMQWSYKDFSDTKCHTGKSFKDQYRDQGMINKMKEETTDAHFLCEGLGVMGVDGEGWFSDAMVINARKSFMERNVQILTARSQLMGAAGREVFFFAGVDPAPSEGKRSADGTIVIAMAEQKTSLKSEARSLNGKKEPAILSPNPQDWWYDTVYARVFTAKHKLSARQWSGMIHLLHQRFQLTGLMIDAGAGGGGYLVKRELIATQQLINGVETRGVTPIGDTVEDMHKVTMGHFILIMYERPEAKDKGGMALLWPDLPGDEMLNDAAYAQVAEDLDNQVVGLPAAVKDWLDDAARQAEHQGWEPERQWCLRNLDALVSQMGDFAVELNEDGTQKQSKRGGRVFFSTGKKDLISAWMMARVRFLIWLRAGNQFEDIEPENESMVFGGMMGR